MNIITGERNGLENKITQSHNIPQNTVIIKKKKEKTL